MSPADSRSVPFALKPKRTGRLTTGGLIDLTAFDRKAALAQQAHQVEESCLLKMITGVKWFEGVLEGEVPPIGADIC
jgi:hypothetical protein